MLNAAGFPATTIVLSNNLDELVIWQIITQIRDEAPRWGVDPTQLIDRLAFGAGTRLITSWGEPALGGVYKLVAVCHGDEWVPAIKISESADKTPNPGHKYAWRVYDQRGNATADLLSLESEDARTMRQITLRHPSDHTKSRTLFQNDISEIEPLLVEVLREGKLVYDLPTIEEMRTRREQDVSRLDPGVKRLLNPHIYHVSLTDNLWKVKQSLVASAMDQSQ
jgi:nicotinate phosphoribosyltransferase